MGKYEYKDGERRYHRGCVIWRHANHELYPYLVWYVETNKCISIGSNYCPCQVVRVYFRTIRDAEKYIDRIIDNHREIICENGYDIGW